MNVLERPVFCESPSSADLRLMDSQVFGPKGLGKHSPAQGLPWVLGLSPEALKPKGRQIEATDNTQTNYLEMT